ncbi:deoxyribose-phosphate aldolase [Veillonella sp. YH-vei2232]|uniref:Deoxyribose-phosphate aldolase n=1 Tax=Veillonella absiana TaxID=3079305 RepID=A0ABU3Z5W7_9FIRM|nr:MULTISPECIES: deoxyribose-phosphate aldolase [unclassified Veillonella]MDV5063798.1 deoxyribose-phosphate aldolase [Veillonella sp. YH-vei2232]MDV5087304.1 deoxyribose-phosphate aldolase [Veillonella sp. YH-vei2233]
MYGRDILSKVDHTLLKPDATWDAIKVLCDEAVAYKAASVCIPPNYVKRVADEYPDLVICTVVGFPLGYQTTEVKLAETRQALAEGATEIDMVIDVTDVKNGDYRKVTEEIRALKKACGTHVLKVIVEACYLTEAEKIAMCKAVTEAGADYIKTSTGFGTGGTTIKDVALFKEHIGAKVKIKAAGGIRMVEDMVAYLELGCSRIGASAAVGLLKNRLDDMV